jgi:tRNA-dihydrouridine synthase
MKLLYIKNFLEKYSDEDHPVSVDEIIDMLENREVAKITQKEKIEVALYQLSLAIEDKGERMAVFESRKQIAEYIKGINGAAEIRFRINNAESFQEVKAILEEKIK